MMRESLRLDQARHEFELSMVEKRRLLEREKRQAEEEVNQRREQIQVMELALQKQKSEFNQKEREIADFRRREQ